MATFWLAAALLTLLALAILLVPLWRERQRTGNRAISGPIAAIAVAPAAIVLYLAVTSFDPDAPHSAFAEIEQLADRLASEPDDVEGWRLLGRSYSQLGDYGRARAAFEEAWNRTEEPDDALKLNYAQAMLFTEEGAAQGLAGNLIEELLERSPPNDAALFYGGIVAMERNEPSAAVDRWTALLERNPPPEIADLIRDQLLQLTGQPVAALPGAAVAAGPVIEIDVRVADEIDLARFGPSARVMILARGKDSRAPIAIKQPPPALSALPGRFSLSDADAIAGMAAGRSLSQYDEVTVIARISATGQAAEQSGDVYAEATIDPNAGETVSLVIDRIIP